MAAQAPSDRLNVSLAVVISGCALLASGCCSLAPIERHRCPEYRIPVARAVPDTACPDWRWIGITEDPYTCPEPRDPTGWTVRRLFDEPEGRAITAREPAEKASPRKEKEVPAGLRPFCLYEHDGAGADLTKQKLKGLTALARDCMAVLPTSALTEAALPGLEAYFLRQAGAFDPPVSPPSGFPLVRLALLDTAPTGNKPAAGDPPNNSPHGYTLANMAKKLGCADSANCTAEVTARLALPWVEYEPSSFALSKRDTIHGGFVGMISELAEAIHHEVAAKDPSQPLVLNLSVGWNPYFGGLEANVTDMPASVQAVHAALVDALCRGVATVAAGGNLTRGEKVPPSHGPLLPAAWEPRALLTKATCTAALEPGAEVKIDDESPSTYRPLVNAVGAVEADDAPLGNARLDAEPRLVGFGDHGVVQGEADGKATAMLTGSSVSTLVASTALAWIRAYLPELGVFEAVDKLYQSGVELGRPADVYQAPPAGSEPGQAPTVHRVLVGKVAMAACKDCQGPACASPCPAWEPAPLGPLPPGGYGDFADTPLVHVEDLTEADPLVHSACAPKEWKAALEAAGKQSGPEQFHGGGAALVYRCPHWQFYDTSFHGMTGTQPGSDPCSSCGFGGGGGGGTAPSSSAPTTTTTADGVLYIEIDPAYIGQLSSPVLMVGNQTYALPDLFPGSKLRIDGITVGPNDALQLSFVVNGVRSATSLFLRTQ